jgi:hypothetical protein
MIGGQQQIGAEQLVRLAVERLTHAVGKETHRRQGGHGHRQRRRQQAQLPAARVAPQHSPGEGAQRQDAHEWPVREYFNVKVAPATDESSLPTCGGQGRGKRS